MIFKKIKELLSFSFIQLAISSPALKYALLMLIGIWIRFESIYILFLIPIFMKKKIVSLLIIAFSFLYTLYYYPKFPDCPSYEPMEGVFAISTIIPSNNYNKSGFLYLGKMKQMKLKNTLYKNLPSSVYLSSKNLLDPSYTYKIVGKVKSKNFSLSIKLLEFAPYEKVFNCVEKRKEIKIKVHNWIVQKIKDSDVSSFFSGLLIGYVDDKFLSFNFKRVGLQHIMAISGFHFNLLALFFSFILKRIFKNKSLPIALLLIINLYFFYIGNSPSILRAYVSTSILLIGMIISKKNYPMNSLGLALIIEFLQDPLNLKNVGFQLSFVSVLAIFLIYPVIEKVLSNFLKKRKKDEMSNFPWHTKIAAILINFLRESFALTLAVNLAILPIMLFYFHKVPLLSFFYNLFFPPAMMVSLMMLFISFLLPFDLFFSITSYFTKAILNPILHPPILMEYNIYSKIFTPNLTALYLFICFSIFLMIFYSKKYKEKEFFRWI